MNEPGPVMVTHKKSPVRILLVDDQRSRMLSYEAMLSDLGHELVQARSGPEALQLLMRDDYALVLLDVNMPIMDGFETAQLIHQHPRFEKTPIIFVTAFHFTDLDRIKAYELGAVDYVFLPVVPAVLRSKVSVLVELYCKRRELQELNEHLRHANAELALANSTLQAERTRELERFTRTLEKANAELAQANDVLRAEASVRQRTELALRTSEGRLRAILQNTSALIYQMDLDGRFVHVNRMFEDLFHRSSEEVRGASVHDVFPREIALAMEANHRSVLELGHPVEFEEVLTIDGTPHAYASVKAPLLDDSGKVSGIVSVSTDVTERKNLVEALRQADRRKDEFLAVLAHELRNPLAPIVNAAQLMRSKRFEDKELVWCREVIERQARHLSRLVDDLLDVSRITQGKIKLQKEPVDVADVVARAIETNRPIIEAKQQIISVRQSDEPLVVQGDATRLSQVIANLVNNAAKYTEAGGQIWLTVETSSTEAGREVLIRVKDKGVGIPRELLPQVFDLFTQGDHTLERTLGGLGVGLALVRRLVDMHGGTVTGHSEGAGKGSEFVVRLPLAPERRAAAEPRPVPEAAGATRRILIVDDNIDSATGLCMLLQRNGNHVRMAHDGLSSLEIARGFRPEVMLLDIGMPQMNGYELARRIRAEPWGKGPVLVAVTGWSQEDVRAKALEAGFDLHMTKPVDTRALTELIVTLPQRPGQLMTS